MKRLPFLPIAWTLAGFAAVVFALDNLAGALSGNSPSFKPNCSVRPPPKPASL